MTTMQSKLAVQRVRHPIVVRTITVKAKEQLAQNYVRFYFTSPELAGFVSSSFDDHIKLFFPLSGKAVQKPQMTEQGLKFPDPANKPVARDYTPRAFDAERLVLEVDFVLHEDGPAGSWALQAEVGDQLVMAGPRGSMVIPEEYDWHLLIGDETALPAMTRRIAELPASKTVMAVLETDDPQLQHLLPVHDGLRAYYVQRQANQPLQLAQKVQQLVLPEGIGFAWAAAESAVAKAVRAELVAKGLENTQIRASSYWRQGDAGVHETLS